MNLSELQALAASVGFPDSALAAAVAMAESSGNPRATNIVTEAQATAWNQAHPGQPPHGPERSFGLWQINTLAHPSYDESSLLDPTYNARAALAVSSNGTNWRPWSTYTSGIYKRFLPLAPEPAPVESDGLGLPLALTLAAVIVGAGAVIAYNVSKPRGLFASEPNPTRRRHSGKVQTLIFSKRAGWTSPKAKAWARSHGYRATKTDVTDESVRVRQAPPGRFTRLRTVRFGRGIRAVVGWTD